MPLVVYAGQINCTADSISTELSDSGEPTVTTLQGNVSVTYQDIALHCEKAVIDHQKSIITIEGEADFLKGALSVKSSGLTYNFERNIGSFTSAQFSYPPYYGFASRFEKTDEDCRLESGFVTTCDRALPHYRVRCGRIVLLPKKIIAESVTIYLGRTPIFRLPRFSQRLDAKKPIFQVSPGYRTELGKTLAFIFNHSAPGNSNVTTSERIEIGEKGLGAGWSIEDSTSSHRNFRAFGFTDYSERDFSSGFVGEFQKEFSNNQNLIVDWRSVSSDNFFHDYMYQDFLNKARYPSSASYTRLFSSGIFGFQVTGAAGEELLKPERLPEIYFSSPYFPLGRFIGSADISVTRFLGPGSSDYIRSSTDFILEKPIQTSTAQITPFVSVKNLAYFESSRSYNNLVPSVGVKGQLLATATSGSLTQVFSPAFSLFSRFPSDKNLPFSADMKDQNSPGTFIGAELSWSFLRSGASAGKILFQNDYNITHTKFEDGYVSYEFPVSPRVKFSGQQRFNFSEGGMIENYNDLTVSDTGCMFSIGNRYFRDSFSGLHISAGRKIGRIWTVGSALDYDIQNSRFSRQEYYVERLFHCLVFKFSLVRGLGTSVYFTVVPEAFSHTVFPK